MMASSIPLSLKKPSALSGDKAHCPDRQTNEKGVGWWGEKEERMASVCVD